ncbi:SigB/SigF/SigG family RNA polymerase sigma factor [Streptomyces tsukubensis]|uniref:RNA polymerase subunit sigma n=1 Tax=Streptomyces tsukubensis TaxID=83656 RepID=A0A1V4AF89_9ACTN|nr:SigB/SigF/SigG family RNA polymerase sigma factor [Streptomyces tsukubensis]OON82059.1 RNA polymerase subunit sigma [Streptomyces tsukubensis]QFR92547.1 SigB/SigF/SigG family RNA polymerase sigma factor [Streptomyces tsukubensis]
MPEATEVHGASRTVSVSRPAPYIPELPRVERPSAVSPQDSRELSKLFFSRLATLEEGTPEHQYVRNTLVELNLSLVKFAAARFRSRSESTEEIVQVGTIGLIKAINRFELARGIEFASFAMPCVIGEIKRFFRDTSWAVHVPRRLQELRIELARATDLLHQSLDRAPTTKELAVHLGIDEENVMEGLLASNAYSAGSLDMPLDDSGEDASHSLADRVGALDPALETVETVGTLKPLIDGLDARDRRILQMRFGDEMTQAQIGVELGVSQMHVSRLLTRITARLRRGMLAG